MFYAEFKKIIVVTPQFEMAEDGKHEFQWTAHLPLPFPLPSSCVKRVIDSKIGTFEFGIHQHMDRTFIYVPKDKSKKRPPTLKVLLHKKGSSGPTTEENYPMRRESLTAVATISEIAKYNTAKSAFEANSEKVELFISTISDVLSEFQLRAPFTCAWMIYPPNVLELESVYVNVLWYKIGETPPKPNLHASSPVFFTGMNLKNATFTMDLPESSSDLDGILRIPYQLLAQSVTSLHRGTAALSIVNAIGAVEILAENISEEFLANVDSATQENYKAKFHKAHGNLKFRLHQGLKILGFKSLFDDDNKLYSLITSWNEKRNNLVHKGNSILPEDAEEGVLTCCRVVRWLAKLSGRRAKGMYPKKKEMKDFIMRTASNTDAGFYWQMGYVFVNDEKTKMRSEFKLVGPPCHTDEEIETT